MNITRSAPRLRVQIVTATVVRMVMNTAHRMVYPFLPAISRGLGVPLESLTWVLSLRSALGMTSPFFGGIPDRFGRRQAMLLAMAVFCGGVILVALWPSYLAFALFLILVVVSKFIFDPALQAYLGDRTPYARRGLVIAFTELGWSGAALVGFPLLGLLIGRRGWASPFWPFSLLGLLGGLALWLIIPRDAPEARPEGRPRLGHWALVWRDPIVLAGLSLGLFISAANENLNVVYAAWMERSFGLSVAQLGLSTTVIGVAELAGESLVMGLADRLGKRRAIAAGMVASALAYLALPLLGSRGLELALGALFFAFITFEFTIVASIPLMTELLPAARGRVMSANVAAHAAGRMLGALAGGALFHLGFVWVGILSAALNLAALAVILILVRERH